MIPILSVPLGLLSAAGESRSPLRRSSDSNLHPLADWNVKGCDWNLRTGAGLAHRKALSSLGVPRNFREVIA